MWYFEDYKRFRREREALELLGSSEGWLTPLGWRIDGSARMIWEADIATPAGNRPVTLRYPNHFPHSPPLVLPRDDTSRWSQHQYGPGGELCLEPMVWAEVFGGGFGGLIVRYRPSNEPDPASMRRAVENWCADKGKPMPRPANRYGGEPHASAIADDADVTVIAAHTARMAVDLLIPRDPSIFPHSVYMVGLTGGWIFDQPFETHPIEIEAVPDAGTEEPLDVEDAKAEFDRIVQLFAKYKDAAASDSPSDQTSSD